MKRPIEVMTYLETVGKDVEYFPTGFRKLDEHLEGGFFRQEVIVLGASTGIGKSYLSCQIAHNIAQESYKVGIFSLEISAEMIISRLLGQVSGVRSGVIKKGEIPDHQMRDVTSAKAKIASVNDLLEIHDDIYEYAEIEKAVRKGEYDFVVIDFLQNCSVNGTRTEYETMTTAIRGFQQLAKKENCAILILSQLSNQFLKEKDDSILEYKGSGAIAHACDLGFRMKRDFTMATLDLHLMKNRRGPIGDFVFSISNAGGRISEQ